MSKIFWSLLFPLSVWAAILIPSSSSEPARPYYDLYEGSQQVGHVASYELSALGIVIIHSLYVHPLSREKGYAQQMLSLLLSHYENQGYAAAYIQIGPYEKGQYLDEQSNEYRQRILKLQKLYTRCGFEPASDYEQYAAAFLYPMFGIHASAQYLLKKDLFLQPDHAVANSCVTS